MSGSDSGITDGDQITMEQDQIEAIIAEIEANAASTFDANIQTSISDFDSFPKEINEGKQGKHIPGHNNYQIGKSELIISISEANKLVREFSGHGKPVGDNKERVDFGKIIGYYRDPATGVMMPTSIGMIHYSNTGTHIVPARPRED